MENVVWVVLYAFIDHVSLLRISPNKFVECNRSILCDCGGIDMHRTILVFSDMTKIIGNSNVYTHWFGSIKVRWAFSWAIYFESIICECSTSIVILFSRLSKYNKPSTYSSRVKCFTFLESFNINVFNYLYRWMYFLWQCCCIRSSYSEHCSKVWIRFSIILMDYLVSKPVVLMIIIVEQSSKFVEPRLPSVLILICANAKVCYSKFQFQIYK